MARKSYWALGLGAAAVVLVGTGAIAAAAGRRPDENEQLGPTTTTPISWSLASIVLADMPDPYNQALAEATIDKNRDHQFSGDDKTVPIYTTIRTVIGVVPVVGQIVTVVYKFIELLGPLIVGRSEGGWDKLPLLARQRAAIYLAVPRDDFLNLPRPYPSQRVDVSAPTERPERRGRGFGAPLNPSYDAEFAAWLRRYLQVSALSAELFRISRSTDEPMLPKVAIELLWEAGAWPPPIEPMPLTTQEYVARFAGTANPAQYFPYEEGTGWLNSKIIRLSDAPDDQQADLALATATYQKLRAEYEADAAAFSARIVEVTWPAELVQLALNAGCVPRLGSPADPLRFASTPGASYA